MLSDLVGALVMPTVLQCTVYGAFESARCTDHMPESMSGHMSGAGRTGHLPALVSFPAQAAPAMVRSERSQKHRATPRHDSETQQLMQARSTESMQLPSC